MSQRGPVLPDSVTIEPAYGTAPSPVRDLATVDVWHAQLGMAPERLRTLSQCLNSNEHARAARFHFDQHRARFIAGRGLLRHLLSRYLNEPPERIRFAYGSRGKPFLLEYPDLHFNLSHAADMLLIGVAHGRRLGVDVEPVPSDDVGDSASGIVFSAAERRALQGLAAARRREFFAQLWTRKEAYIKADGRGMSIPLDHLDTSIVPGRMLLLNDTCDQWVACSRWTLVSLPVGDGYVGAIAAEGDWQFSRHDLE